MRTKLLYVVSEKKFDKRFLIAALAIGILLPLIFLVAKIMSEEEFEWFEFYFAGIFTFVITIIITLVNTRIAFYIGKRFPWKQGWAKRIAIELLITSISAAIIISLVVTGLYYISNLNNQESIWYILFQNSIIAVVINIILITFIEARDLFILYKNSIIETEVLKRQNIESQYSALMNQVNPHFLFNSLNVLSFLVSSDTEKAQEFISRFSWIYRYVLDVKDKSLVSLDQELEFLNAYLFMQKIRYENKLDFRIEISNQASEVFIENAIKHNEISTRHPLMIEISTERDFLVVKNHFLPRKDREPSTGNGLKNILARYEHFTDNKPFFGQIGDDFIAKIPLLSE